MRDQTHSTPRGWLTVLSWWLLVLGTSRAFAPPKPVRQGSIVLRLPSDNFNSIASQWHTAAAPLQMFSRNKNNNNNEDQELHQQHQQHQQHHQIHVDNPSNFDNNPNLIDANKKAELEETNRRKRLRQRVNELARQMVSRPMPKAIATVLRDATMSAVDMAVEEVLSRRPSTHIRATQTTAAVTLKELATVDATNNINASSHRFNPATISAKEAILSELTLDLVNDAFEPMEQSLREMEISLEHARAALTTAKSQAYHAIEAIQAAAIAQAEGAASIVQNAEEEAERKVIKKIYTSADVVDDIASMKFEDLDFEASEMAPPFLDEDQCLIPGEPVVRVEKAPENSRRIFAGIDIMASVDDVWKILTNYEKLHEVVPNLVVNEVLDLYDGVTDYDLVQIDTTKSDREQCRDMAQQMKGALLKQVGGAKVAGINFSARTTVEVREWPQGLPDFAHYQDEVWEGKSRNARAKEYAQTKLERYIFPRPFAISSLPTKDISMQSILDDDGEFRLYQGVWRMQPLPGCSGTSNTAAMRLTYAVEISPRAYLPVQLVEGRIVKDLCNNLLAIRNCVEKVSSSDQKRSPTVTVA